MSDTLDFPKIQRSTFRLPSSRFLHEQHIDVGQVSGFVSAIPNCGDAELVEVNRT